ncbi:MAG: multidrug transporter, partial [Zoogloea oleivorans]|nr:multidrug transporter [Zoogloea oleivorans]
MKLRTLGLTLLLAGVLGGCATLAPDYARPAAPVENTWPATGGKVANTGADESVATLGWRAFFVDTRLHQLIDLALVNNRDLRETAL